MEDPMAQKILKALDEYRKALTRMGRRLTRLEESKFKKPPHVEIHDDEEEDEEWNEKDEVEYERNKQFEKLTVETMAMREKMEKMQLVFCKVQGMDDYLYNMGGMSSKAPIILPKFKISDAKKFNGTGDPKQHVRRYLSIAKMKGLDEKQTLHAFPLLLTGGASRWYYSLDPSKTKVQNELVGLFGDQFIFNTMIDVTLRDLETTKQGVGETFSEYMTRWKTKASRMVNRPNEKDQINMIIRTCFRLIIVGFCHRLLAHLENYVIVGQELKMPLTMNNWRKGIAGLQPRKYMEGEQPPLKHPIP